MTMTPEARLARLERIARLLVKAGLRYRYDLREIGDKLNIVVNTQIRSEELSSQNQVRLTKLAERTDRKFAELAVFQKRTDEKFAELAAFQKRTEESLAELIKIVLRGSNGNADSN